ncbi:hypothetical protein HDV06_006952 [Boothiomyces sp. JEL0866]|nr:hypothetical protein HDV06_006952 [Boothiomyces sp. JEL0866]
MGETVLQTGWYGSYNCKGIPDTIVIFNETTPTPLYSSNSDFNPIPICGTDPYSIDLGCCLSSLDLKATYGYQSFSRNYLSEFSFQQSITPGANGQTYCAIASLDTNSLYGYQQMYLHQRNVCVEETFICGETGLTVFSDPGCAGSNETIAITATPTYYQSIYIGNLTVSMREITGANLEIVWIANVPPPLLIPNFSEPLEILELALFIITVLAYALLIFAQLRNYKKGFKKMKLWQLLVSIAWLVRFCYSIYYVYTIFLSDLSLAIASYCLIVFDITIMASSVITCYTLFEIFKVNSVRKRVFCICLLFLTHIVFELPIFIYGFPVGTFGEELYVVAAPFRTIWRALSLIFDLIPPTIIFILIIRQFSIRHSKSEPQEEKNMYRNNHKLVAIMTLQLLTGIYYIFTFTCNFAIVRTDRQYLSFDGIGQSVLLWHELLLILMYRSLTSTTKQLVSPKTTPHATSIKQRMLLDSVIPKSNEPVDHTVVIK